MTALFDALLARNTSQATHIVLTPWVGAVNSALPDIEATLANVVSDAAQSSIEGLSPIAGISVTFGGPASQAVQRVIREQSTRMITMIGETERGAIRDILLDMSQRGTSPTQAARQIREYIGLTRPQAATLERFRQTMEDAGLKASKIEERIAARVKKMIRYRANVIARNEAVTSSVTGNRLGYMELANTGQIDVNIVRRRWVVANDERLCQVCAPVPGLNPEGRRLDEPYVTPIGNLMIPHAHVMCRCTEILRFP